MPDRLGVPLPSLGVSLFPANVAPRANPGIRAPRSPRSLTPPRRLRTAAAPGAARPPWRHSISQVRMLSVCRRLHAHPTQFFCVYSLKNMYGVGVICTARRARSLLSGSHSGSCSRPEPATCTRGLHTSVSLFPTVPWGPLLAQPRLPLPWACLPINNTHSRL